MGWLCLFGLFSFNLMPSSPMPQMTVSHSSLWLDIVRHSISIKRVCTVYQSFPQAWEASSPIRQTCWSSWSFQFRRGRQKRDPADILGWEWWLVVLNLIWEQWAWLWVTFDLCICFHRGGQRWVQRWKGTYCQHATWRCVMSQDCKKGGNVFSVIFFRLC